MADRKKRKFTVKSSKSDNKKAIKKEPELDNENLSRLEIVKGTRRKRKITRIVIYCLIAIVILILLILNLLSPTGLIEAMQNKYASIGKGVLPANVFAQNCDNCYSYNDTVTLINDSYFEIYNDNGKLIQAFSHGMSNPKLCVSEARFMLFDRGKYTVSVYNYSNKLFSRTFEKAIYSADISRSGAYAVVTDSDLFRNSVALYNKNDELIYSWDFTEGYITDVAISEDGENIAICTTDSKDGSFITNIFIFKEGSQTPVYIYSFNELLSSITSVNDEYLIANGFDTCYTVNWNSNNNEEIMPQGVLRFYDYSINGNSVITYGRENNESENTVTVINTKGSIATTFTFNRIINDISINEKYILVLSDNSVYIYNNDGTFVSSVETDSKYLFAVLSESGKIFAVNNTELTELKYNQEGK